METLSVDLANINPGTVEAYAEHLEQLCHQAVLNGGGGAVSEVILSYTRAVISPEVFIPLPSSRYALAAITQKLTALPLDQRIQLTQAILELIQTRLVAFEEQVQVLREMLAGWYEEQEDWSYAAQALIGIPLNSGHRTVPDAYKLKLYIHIVRLLLEEEKMIEAENYLNRASLLLPPPPSLTVQAQENEEDGGGGGESAEMTAHRLIFLLSQARILDHKRKFLDASWKYLQLSYSKELDSDERQKALSQAVVCGILAPAGPLRSRLLSVLYKDDRVHELKEFSILQSVFLVRFLMPESLAEFRALLQPHHLASMKNDTSTVLDHAVLEHNIGCAAQIYLEASITELALRLQVKVQLLEDVIAVMIKEGRLRASIDQVDGFVSFHQGDLEKGGEIMEWWDEGIRGVCLMSEKVVERIRTTVTLNDNPTS